MLLTYLLVLAAARFSISVDETPPTVHSNTAIIINVHNDTSKAAQYTIRVAVKMGTNKYVDATEDALQRRRDSRRVTRVIYPHDGLTFVWVPGVFKENCPLKDGTRFKFRLYEYFEPTKTDKVVLRGETRALQYRK